MPTEKYFAYWGKASSGQNGGAAYHLLVFHALDVAACGACLLKSPRFSLQTLADELGWSLVQTEAVFVYFLALHDLGKFARAFQGQVSGLSPDLVPPDEDRPYTQRHDTLGWWLWREWAEADGLPERLPASAHAFWAIWMRSVTGHHGKPPKESEMGVLQADASAFFRRDDRQAAWAFATDVAAIVLPPDVAMPVPTQAQYDALKPHAWRLAGLAVLADWLGSHQAFFPYYAKVQPLQAYWQHAQAQAAHAVAAAGLYAAKVRDWPQPAKLFDYLHTPTPLQHYAATVALEPGPQLFLLEDVTGAGKTEAALILAQRLMQTGHAHGLYFALPSMASANQMYQRVGQVYRRLYREESAPSLVLAHGARQLLEAFRNSVLQPQAQAGDSNYRADELSASAQCKAWLADNNKKALLADVGVGTLDQALLAILPARHQSLRLLGLANKVLLIDEVHAYDPYMMGLLRTLLSAHARQGGSAILLSATLPLATRNSLLAEWRAATGAEETALEDLRYPLAIHAGQKIETHACQTRPQLRRHVEVKLLHAEEDAFAKVVEAAQAGRCIAWIRNTVEDARRAWHALRGELDHANVRLFHSRYAMGDRLDIEADVLARFGKHSGATQRAGKVLIGTQVIEQSLDLDVDAMVSDLAPIDLIIQRAGRLQRHARAANGDPAADGIEQRLPPVLYVLSPDPVDAPEGDWYAELFPKAKYVYPDAGKLWLGARALLAAGGISTPGSEGQLSAVRSLVEAVYGADDDAIPERLRRASREQLGKDLAMQSQAGFNALKLEMGYCIDSSARWYEDHQVPTRLGDETRTLYLARWQDGVLHPLCSQGQHVWEESSLRVHAHRAAALAPVWQARFAAAIAQLRSQYRLLEEPAFVLPLADDGQGLVAQVLDAKGREQTLRYSLQEGLFW